MMKAVYLVWIVSSTTWTSTEVREYLMPTMEACIASAKAAKVASSPKGGTVTLFCIEKPAAPAKG